MTATGSLGAIFHRLTYQGIAKNTIYQLIGKVFTALSALVIVRLVNTHYGTSGAGELFTLLNFFNIFYLLADFGVNAVAVKRMVENPDEEAKVIQVLLGLRLASGIALLLVAIFVASILTGLMPYDPVTNVGYSPIFKAGVLLLSGTILTQGIYLTTTALYQKRQSYGGSVFALGAGAVASAIVFLFLSQSSTSLLFPLTGFLVGGLVSALLALTFVPVTLRNIVRPIFQWREWQKLIMPSLPIAATLVLNVIYFKSDSFILRSLKPIDDVGIYGVAYKVFDQAIVIPVFFVNALYPVMLQQFTYNIDKIKRTLFVSSSLLLLGGVAIGLTQFILAPWLIQIVDGTEQSVLPLRILAAGLPFFFVSNIFLWLLVTLGKQSYLIFIYGASMAFNLIANMVLIPKYSYIASAVLTGVSEGIVLALTMGFGLYFLNKKLREGS